MYNRPTNIKFANKGANINNLKSFDRTKGNALKKAPAALNGCVITMPYYLFSNLYQEPKNIMRTFTAPQSLSNRSVINRIDNSFKPYRQK